MRKAVLSFLSDESGATAIEYSLMIALVGIAVIPAFDLVGDALAGVFQTISLDLNVAAEGAAVPDSGPGGSGSEGSGAGGSGSGGAGDEGAGDDLADGGAHGDDSDSDD